MPSYTLGGYANANRGAGTPWSFQGSPPFPYSFTTAQDGSFASNAAINNTDSASTDATDFRDLFTNAAPNWTNKTMNSFNLYLLGRLQGFQTTIAIVFAQANDLNNNFQINAIQTPWVPDSGNFDFWLFDSTFVGSTWGTLVRDLLLANNLLISLINSPRFGSGICEIDQVRLDVAYTDIAPPPTARRRLPGMEV